MRHMYEIGADLQRVMELVADPETDWESIGDTVEMIEEEFLEKADAYGKVMKNVSGDIEELDADIKTLKEEVARLTARKRGLENNVNFLKNTFLNVMQITGQQKVKTDRFTFFQLKTYETVIDNFDAIPEKYVKVEKSAKKSDIKRYIDENGPVEWAHLQENVSLQYR